MPTYRAEATIQATLYVTADSPEEAKEKIAAYRNTAMELNEQNLGDGLEISGHSFGDPAHSDVSLSPAMTLDTIEDELEQADDGDDEDEEEDLKVFLVTMTREVHQTDQFTRRVLARDEQHAIDICEKKTSDWDMTCPEDAAQVGTEDIDGWTVEGVDIDEDQASEADLKDGE